MVYIYPESCFRGIFLWVQDVWSETMPSNSANLFIPPAASKPNTTPHYPIFFPTPNLSLTPSQQIVIISHPIAEFG